MVARDWGARTNASVQEESSKETTPAAVEKLILYIIRRKRAATCKVEPQDNKSRLQQKKLCCFLFLLCLRSAQQVLFTVFCGALQIGSELTSERKVKFLLGEHKYDKTRIVLMEWGIFWLRRWLIQDSQFWAIHFPTQKIPLWNISVRVRFDHDFLDHFITSDEQSQWATVI